MIVLGKMIKGHEYSRMRTNFCAGDLKTTKDTKKKDTDDCLRENDKRTRILTNAHEFLCGRLKNHENHERHERKDTDDCLREIDKRTRILTNAHEFLCGRLKNHENHERHERKVTDDCFGKMIKGHEYSRMRTNFCAGD